MSEILNNQYFLQLIIENQIFFAVFFTILIIKIKQMSKKNIYLATIVYFIGTFFHELAHYIAALITTFRIPNGFSLFPKIKKENGHNRIILGYVLIEKEYINVFNAFLIGMAPLSLLFLAYLVSRYYFQLSSIWWEINILNYLAYLFLLTTLIVNSVPSRMDFIVAKTKGSLYLYLLLILAYLFYI